MLSTVSRTLLRSAVAANSLSVVGSKRFFLKSPIASVMFRFLFYYQEEEPDEANCPKAKVVLFDVSDVQAFDDLMDKKEKEKKPSKLNASQMKDDDYPFDLEEEDYVVMVQLYRMY